MTPERAERLQQLFLEALDKPAGQRDAFLRTACGDDTALLAELNALLAADERSKDILEAGPGPFFRLLVEGAGPAPDPWIGRAIGPYRITRELGAGGMGRVFLAERPDVGKQVAIKLIRSSLAGPEIVRRFLLERRVLARLDHPNIARMLDAGTTEEGIPYLVIEYVEGEPLTAYCDRLRLSLQARLRLFLDTCEAVQYAHRNLVIHRDLKPSNILVMPPAGSIGGLYGQVKLLDFGIAKLLEADAAEDETVLTHTGARVMTPEYAAPEQVLGAAVTTTTDVYALGVLFYVLMTGQRPYELRGRPLAEVERIICEEEPPRPSVAVARLKEQALRSGTAAAQRLAADLERLRRDLGGDLDTIALKALRKEPGQRYPSVEAFAEDIRRYLEGRPVRARPQTVGYRLSKFNRRHRAAVTAGGLVLLLLSVFVVREARLRAAAEAARDTARREALESEEVAAFLVGLFDVSDPFSQAPVRGDTVTARTLLAEGAARVEAELAGQPDVQAALLHAIGRVYSNLGLFPQADSLFTKTLALRRAHLGPDHPDVAESLRFLGWVAHQQGDFARADSFYDLALPLLEALAEEDLQKMASLLNDMGLNEQARGDFALAESLHQAALTRWRRLRGSEHADITIGLNNLGMAVSAGGNYAAAESLFQQALDMRVRLLGEEHPDVLNMLANLAGAQLLQGRPAAAESLYRRVVDLRRRMVGTEHPISVTDLNNLGVVLSRQARYAEAEAVFREALDLGRRVLGDDHPEVVKQISNLASALDGQERDEEAQVLYREALAAMRVSLGPRHPSVAVLLNNMAQSLRDLGRHAEAEGLHREALSIQREALGEQHPRVAETMSNLGSVLRERGDYPASVSILRQALQVAAVAYTPGHPNPFTIKSNLAASLTRTGGYEEAEQLLLESLPALEDAFGADHPRTRSARERLVELYEAWNRPQQAARYRRP